MQFRATHATIPPNNAERTQVSGCSWFFLQLEGNVCLILITFIVIIMIMIIIVRQCHVKPTWELFPCCDPQSPQWQRQPFQETVKNKPSVPICWQFFVWHHCLTTNFTSELKSKSSGSVRSSCVPASQSLLSGTFATFIRFVLLPSQLRSPKKVTLIIFVLVSQKIFPALLSLNVPSPSPKLLSSPWSSNFYTDVSATSMTFRSVHHHDHHHHDRLHDHPL